MLVLTRSIDEAIVIDNDIVVRIVDIRGNKVRIGVAAAKEVLVHREETQTQVEAERVRDDSWVVTVGDGQVVLQQGQKTRTFPTIAAAVEWLDWRKQQRGGE